RRISPQTRILVNCVIIKENMDHLQQLVEEVAQAGAHALTLQHETFITEKEVNAHEHVWNSLFDDETPSPLSVPIQKTGRCNAKAIEKAVNTAQSYGTSVGLPVFVKPDLCEDALPSWYEGDFHPKGRCSYLYTDARINPYGDVVACQSLPLILGNIRQQSLPTIFNNEQSVRFRRALRSCGGNIPGCSRCCKLYRTF
ncbi:MAG: SPASM domain-containing protein, partial [Candidatus Hydrogenedentes bacterium]|nr:SPASM domain-containing protein [Candidatus Hydrogenedentota bacterium]